MESARGNRRSEKISVRALTPPRMSSPDTLSERIRPTGCGVHTVRNVQEEFFERLNETRSEIEDLVHQVGQKSEDNAFGRAEMHLGPLVGALRLHVDSGTMQTRGYAEGLVSDCRREIHDMRSLHGADLRGIHAELVKLRAEMTSMSTKMEEHNNCEPDELKSAKDLEATAQMLRTSIRETATALKLDLTNVAEKAVHSTVADMSSGLQDKISKMEDVIRDVAERSHKDHGGALDGLRLLQQHIEVRFESLWLDTQAEAKREAMQAARRVRDEIMNSRILDRVDQQMASQQASMDARISSLRDRLCDQVAAISQDVAEKAEANCTLRVTELSDHLSEIIRATRDQQEEQRKELMRQQQKWSIELGHVRKNADAADALIKTSVEDLRSQVNTFDEKAVKLRQDLAQVVLSLDQAVASLQSEMQDWSHSTSKRITKLSGETGADACRRRTMPADRDLQLAHPSSIFEPGGFRGDSPDSSWAVSPPVQIRGPSSFRHNFRTAKDDSACTNDDAESTLPPVSPNHGSTTETPSEWRRSSPPSRSVCFKLSRHDHDAPPDRPHTAA